MADTIRTRTVLLSLLADNTTGEISPQDVRDMLVSLGVYGMIYASEASTPQAGVDTSFATLENWNANGPAAGTTPDYTTGTIVVDTGADGLYLMLAQISFAGSANATYTFHVHKNGVDTLFGTHRKTPSQDVGSCSMVGLVSLVATDSVSIEVKSDQAGGTSLTVNDAQLIVVRVA